MDHHLLAVILGIIEGLTEFLPISSTAHLLIAEDVLGFHAPGEVFPVVIQFGAILAVVAVHWRKFLDVVIHLPSSRDAQHFTLTVLVAFIPSVIAGLLLHGFIKNVLFSPGVAAPVIAFSLIAGGILILVLEKKRPEARFIDGDRLPLKKAFQIGLCQVLAIFPGVSRSGATILGGELLGVSRPAAALFTFYLAVPTMLGATVLDVYKNRDALAAAAWNDIAIGFVVSFLVALVVVKGFIGFISRYGLAPFGWYRIVAGLAIFGYLALA
ncbi:MAG TPA: undecaprenyl-diphosphate phosphatase [Rhizomicrobium sp.]|nr:undecaprenyl-diphosphate phosphatase [Rhizomicrobium sp.]